MHCRAGKKWASSSIDRNCPHGSYLQFSPNPGIQELGEGMMKEGHFTGKSRRWKLSSLSDALSVVNHTLCPSKPGNATQPVARGSIAQSSSFVWPLRLINSYIMKTENWIASIADVTVNCDDSCQCFGSLVKCLIPANSWRLISSRWWKPNVVIAPKNVILMFSKVWSHPSESYDYKEISEIIHTYLEQYILSYFIESVLTETGIFL